MFKTAILLSRYIFLFLIGAFVWKGILFASMENMDEKRAKHAVDIQKMIIHIIFTAALLILSFNQKAGKFEIQPLIVLAVGLAFFFIMPVIVERVFKRSEPLLWNSVFILLAISIIMLERITPALAEKQLRWMAVSFSAILFIPYAFKIVKRTEKLKYFYIAAGIGLIASTLLFGYRDGGSLNWIDLGFISFQPSEIVKFLFVFYLAAEFSESISIKKIAVSGFLSAAVILLLVVQRDLGGALIFFMTYMFMLYMATSSELLFLSGMGAASVAAVAAYKLFSHVRIRVAIWQDPWQSADTSGYQIIQSLFAITTWGFMGSGLTLGMPWKIPIVERDFIFSAICEEFGVLFGIGVILVILTMFLSGMKICAKVKSRYFMLLSAGFISMMAFQSFLIIGGNIKLIPLTGVTLPFLSYGGSSILVSTAMAGILQYLAAFEGRGEDAGE